MPGMKRPDGAAGGQPDVFERQYAAGSAPWDLGGCQPEMQTLADDGVFGKRVLDVGCGTGETSLFLAARGHDVTGIDSAAQAIAAAREKAAERGLVIDFVLADVLDELPILDREYDAVVDVGFFHALTDDQRLDFADKLAAVLVPGGVYAMLCFSERVPGAWGPRRVSEADIRATFAGDAYNVRGVRAAELHSAVPEMPIVDANLAVIERV
jgi:SAM-dependent methyltransferase